MGSSFSKVIDNKIYINDIGYRFCYKDNEWYNINNRNEEYTKVGFVQLDLIELLKTLGFKIFINSKRIVQLIKESNNNKCVQIYITIDYLFPNKFKLIIKKDFSCIYKQIFDLLLYSKIDHYSLINKDTLKKNYSLNIFENKNNVMFKKWMSHNNTLINIQIENTNEYFKTIDLDVNLLINNIKIITDNIDKIGF